MENVQQVRIDDFNFIGPVVPEQVVDLLQRIRQVRSLFPVDGLVKMFPCMCIVKRQGAFSKAGKLCQGWPWGKYGPGGSQAHF